MDDPAPDIPGSVVPAIQLPEAIFDAGPPTGHCSPARDHDGAKNPEGAQEGTTSNPLVESCHLCRRPDVSRGRK